MLFRSLQLRMARAKIDANPMEAAEFLDAAVEALTEATAELRELARGIHPVVLTEGGLQPALRALVERSSIPAKLTEAPDQRFPPAVEAAAYFVVTEALTNVVRYAQAHQARVEIRRLADDVVVDVRDDGVGGADMNAGTGLRGLADRLSALDGKLRVVSRPGHGTRVEARIPCAAGALVAEAHEAAPPSAARPSALEPPR